MINEQPDKTSKNQSRFQGKEYQEVLKWPSARYRLKDKEERMWKGKNKATKYFIVSFIFLLLVMLGILLISLFYKIDQENEFIMVKIMFITLVAFFGSVIVYLVFMCLKMKAVLKRNKPISTEEFIFKSCYLDNHCRDIIKATRDTLGKIYRIDSSRIYPNDTPEILELISCRSENPPFKFELLLGIAYRLGIYLKDDEIDDINMRLPGQARTVEHLAGIICDEIANREKKSDMFIGTSAEKFSGRRQLTKRRGNQFVCPVSLGLCFFVIGMQGLYERRGEGEPEPGLYLLVLMTMLVCGFLLGGLIQIAILVINKYEPLKKIRGSIYLGIICMAVVFIRAANTLKDLNTDTLLSMLVAGGCGFGGWPLLKGIGKWIGSYFESDSRKIKNKKLVKNLIKLQDNNNPALKYCGHLLMNMVNANEGVRIIYKKEPLPLIEGYNEIETPLYGETINWLKELVELEPIPYDTIQQKTVNLNFGKKDDTQMVNLEIEFSDKRDNAYVKLTRLEF